MVECVDGIFYYSTASIADDTTPYFIGKVEVAFSVRGITISFWEM